MLLYLNRFKEDPKNFPDLYKSWKGYDFDVLNELDTKDYISQGSHPSRSKSVSLTEEGMEFAKELLDKYGINDWR